MRPSRVVPTLSLGLVLAACATPPNQAPASAAPVTTPAAGPVPAGIRWVRRSAEHRALFLQVYRAAGTRVRELAAGRDAGAWAVILDADETVLDNSAYQLRRAEMGAGYTSESWSAWVREEAAPAEPGAAAFIALVESLGGRVVVVTNRAEELCDATRRNLARLEIRTDAVLCRRPGDEGKESRFSAVEQGTTPAGLPPVDVALWVGDNIQDFPGLDQTVRSGAASAFEAFGDRYFLLPNPMYGSWEQNPAG